MELTLLEGEDCQSSTAVVVMRLRHCAVLGAAYCILQSRCFVFAHKSIVSDVMMLGEGAGGTVGQVAPIASVQWLAQYNSSVESRGPNAGTSRLAANTEAVHSSVVEEGAEAGWTLCCDIGDRRSHMPCRHLDFHDAFLSAYIRHSPRALLHL